MLNSLLIRNYKNLKEFKLDSLARINLITGRNNTGKSTLLEAISLYASKGDLNYLFQILEEHGEIYKSPQGGISVHDNNIRAISSLFTDRLVSVDPIDAISIGPVEENLFGTALESAENVLTLKLVRFIEEFATQEDGSKIRKRTPVESNSEMKSMNFHIGIEVKFDVFASLTPLEEERFYRYGFRTQSIKPDKAHFIRTKYIDRDINGVLWDNIALSDKEKFVIKALNLIEPRIERLTFIEENTQRQRTAIVKLSDSNTPVPLKSMGDGLNRILTIILALVNCDDGYLLIDEFENGLHYSIQEQLWTIIFDLSKILNIQVFATTHSNDCIKSFVSATNLVNVDSKYIKLEYKNGKYKHVEFTRQELITATKQDIEIR